MTNKAKSKLFDIKLFPMDLARVVFSALPLVFPVKKITPTGEKYKNTVRGGALLAANHTSFLDPILMLSGFWYRRVFFIMADIVMTGRIRSALLRGIGGIKIRREIVDIEAIKKAVSVLKKGRVVALFPQGGIVKSDGIDHIKSGATLMALQAGVPIIPMHICKKKHWYSRWRIVVGDAVVPSDICRSKMPSTADINKITDVLMAEMIRCSDYDRKDNKQNEHI